MRKHSVTIRGHATSYSLEDEFMVEVRRMARERKQPLAHFIAEIDEQRAGKINLSSALRLAVLADLQSRDTS